MPKSPRNDPSGGSQEAVEINADQLSRWPLPRPDEAGDKDTRGRVVVVGGAIEMPGAIVLAGTGALRAGAGKLQMGTCRSIATAVGIAVPEALVFGLDETGAGGIEPRGAGNIAQRARTAGALLIGSGMVDSGAVEALMRALVPLVEDTTLILDAEALRFLKHDPDALRPLAGKAIITPHLGEMADLLGLDKAAVAADPLETARRGAARFQAVVALKGAETFIATPSSEVFCWRHGSIGLATSGSGDTLAGVVAGLSARGASPVQAAAWGVYLHGTAGNILTKRMGLVGFLARELLAEIPGIMARFESGRA